MTTDDNFADDNLPDTDEDEADEEGIHADGKVHLTVCPKVLMRTSTTIPYPSQIKDGTDEKVYIPMTRHKFMFTVYSPDDNLPDTDEDGADEEGVHSYDHAHGRVHRVHR